MSARLHAVTGAFSYTGRYITQRLLAQGERAITLTGHPHRPDPFGGQVPAHAFNFDRPQALAATLRGVDTLYNTYWVRFNRGAVTYEGAVENTRRLIRAAQQAGVRRLVHISIAHADPDSPLPYFRGKGLLEGAIRASGLSYAILRPTVVFGREDVLINNLAWLLRRFPVFAVPGDGRYRLQPIYVADLAALAVSAGAESVDQVIDAVGPETYTFDELIQLLAEVVGRRARLVHLPPALALALARALGVLLRDVLLTREEVQGLMAGLLATHSPPAGATSLRAWLIEHADQVGRSYASELGRHYLPGSTAGRSMGIGLSAPGASGR